MVTLASCFVMISAWIPVGVDQPVRFSDPKKIVDMLMQLSRISDDDKRSREAETINRLIEKNIKTVDKKRALLALEKNLEDRDDSVVYWTAISISKFGEEAKYLLPKLKALLVIKEKLPGSKTSASSIRLAISRIEKY